MSTNNICFRREIRKILCGYPLLSVAMGNMTENKIGRTGKFAIFRMTKICKSNS